MNQPYFGFRIISYLANMLLRLNCKTPCTCPNMPLLMVMIGQTCHEYNLAKLESETEATQRRAHDQRYCIERFIAMCDTTQKGS